MPLPAFSAFLNWRRRRKVRWRWRNWKMIDNGGGGKALPTPHLPTPSPRNVPRCIRHNLRRFAHRCHTYRAALNAAPRAVRTFILPCTVRAHHYVSALLGMTYIALCLPAPSVLLFAREPFYRITTAATSPCVASSSPARCCCTFQRCYVVYVVVSSRASDAFSAACAHRIARAHA